MRARSCPSTWRWWTSPTRRRFGDFFGSRSGRRPHRRHLELFFNRSAPFDGDMDHRALFSTATLTAETVQTAATRPCWPATWNSTLSRGRGWKHAGVPIGVVSAIFGRRSFKVTFRGRPDHAGTTPLPPAPVLVAAAEFVQRAPQLVGQEFPDAVVTAAACRSPRRLQRGAGQRDVAAGVPCGHRRRTSTASRLHCMAWRPKSARIRASAMPGNRPANTCPCPCTPACRTPSAPPRPARLASLDVPSGAGHDALLMAAITPTGMLFAPSIGGRSHCPDEDTWPDDLVAAAQVLLVSVLELADFDAGYD
ncbi:MAG: M20/M25/M40 family metallo-hydrolase [Caldilineaceae bacterium]